jgi:hypothetical protein
VVDGRELFALPRACALSRVSVLQRTIHLYIWAPTQLGHARACRTSGASTQAVWYADFQGFYPCPDAPTTCQMPDDFYATYLKKPLGAPKGPRKKVGEYISGRGSLRTRP